jgi:hypothetical protein
LRSFSTQIYWIELDDPNRILTFYSILLHQHLNGHSISQNGQNGMRELFILLSAFRLPPIFPFLPKIAMLFRSMKAQIIFAFLNFSINFLIFIQN